MKRIPTFPAICAAALALVAGSSAFATNSVYLEAGSGYGSNPYGNSDGGEFTALTSAAIPAGYAASTQLSYAPGSLSGNSTGASAGFETFCIEDETYYWTNTTYDYTVSNSIDVPVGGPFTNGPGFTAVGLDAGVAYLYSQFAQGTLANYDYNLGNTSLDAGIRNTDAGLLQQAIWDLQGPPSDPDVPSPVTLAEISGNVYLQAAYNQFGSSITTLGETTTQYGNNFGVQVMNLTDTSGNNVYQNQLILTGAGVSVPDGGSTVLLLGAALLVLVGIRSRSRQAV